MSALGAPIYFREDDGHQRNSAWSLLSLRQSLSTRQKGALASTADNILYKLDKQDTAELCQDKAQQSFKYPALPEKSVSYLRPTG